MHRLCIQDLVVVGAGSAPIAEGDPGVHSDGACYSRWRLQATAYLDDVPPDSGAFTVREPPINIIFLT
jgi:hypothetical protein